MVMEYKFNPEDFSLSEGWRKVVRKIDAEVLAEKVVGYCRQEREMTKTERRVYKKTLDIIQKDPEIQSICAEYDAWEFDIGHRGISLKDRRNFLDVLGVLYAKIAKPHKDGRKIIPVTFSDKNSYEYLMEKMPSGDVLRRATRDSSRGERYEFSILNPAYAYYFDNNLPSLSMESTDSLLSGLITTCASGTIGKKVANGEGDVIAFVTKNEKIHKRIQFECALRKIWEMSMDYDDRLVNTKLASGEIDREKFVKNYSIFFLKPTELSKYIFKDDRFQYVRDGLIGLTDFSENVENAVIQQTLLKRHKLFKWAQVNELLDQDVLSELNDELQRIEKEHKKVKRIIRNLEKQQTMIENFGDKDKITDELRKRSSYSNTLEEEKDEVLALKKKIKQELFPDKEPGNFNYARKVAKDKLKEDKYE
ncbi:MAG: hypothetical protein KJ697_03875 [Nanoarchaeota archaeon]|nr:hypothetical protein [Nanoarchaeota archaeon]MBU4124332.1 hypothetical protein [Nanoarchaeota archaeon]